MVRTRFEMPFSLMLASQTGNSAAASLSPISRCIRYTYKWAGEELRLG